MYNQSNHERECLQESELPRKNPAFPPCASDFLYLSPFINSFGDRDLKSPSSLELTGVWQKPKHRNVFFFNCVKRTSNQMAKPPSVWCGRACTHKILIFDVIAVALAGLLKQWNLPYPGISSTLFLFSLWGDNVAYILLEVLAIKNFEVSLTGEWRKECQLTQRWNLRSVLHEDHFLPTFPFPSFVY